MSATTTRKEDMVIISVNESAWEFLTNHGLFQATWSPGDFMATIAKDIGNAWLRVGSVVCDAESTIEEIAENYAYNHNSNENNFLTAEEKKERDNYAYFR